MFSTLPGSVRIFKDWTWEQVKPFADDLTRRALNAGNVEAWLKDWSDLSRLVSEMYARKHLATTINTTDVDARQSFNAFLDDIYPRAMELDQTCKEMLLASGLEPEGMEIPLRNMRAEADLFRQANLPLQAEEVKLASQYDELSGEQTVEWDGKELTIAQLHPIYQDPDRSRRERAWRAGMERQLADRQAFNDLWVRCMDVRGQMAANAGMPDYRAYRWQQLLRFDYPPMTASTSTRRLKMWWCLPHSVFVSAAASSWAWKLCGLGIWMWTPWGARPCGLSKTSLNWKKKVPPFSTRLILSWVGVLI